jgi:XTP/dITP diphosphohydrolase
MKLILASRNKKKIREMEALLSQYIEGVRILSLDDVGFAGDIEEDGTTYEENALIKARTAMEAFRSTCTASAEAASETEAADDRIAAIADDSGLSVDVLDGAPGVYSARYAGGHGDDAANNALLLQNLSQVAPDQRTARFVCCIACVFPDGRELTVRGETEGLIIDDARGDGGFGYDPYFYYPPYGKTFAELTADQKNAISHRGKAVEKLAERLLTVNR